MKSQLHALCKQLVFWKRSFLELTVLFCTYNFILKRSRLQYGRSTLISGFPQIHKIVFVKKYRALQYVSVSTILSPLARQNRVGFWNIKFYVSVCMCVGVQMVGFRRSYRKTGRSFENERHFWVQEYYN